ncbi:MAG TPA: DUF456 domain-containing protein [Opitutales bacterium]|nr:DUF456 domain-containing protein [Opitutales bacterium]
MTVFAALTSFGWNSWTAFVVASAIIWLGVFCTLLPVIPGTVLTLAGVIVHRLWMGADESVSWWFVGIGVVVTLLSFAVDYAFTIWGTRRFGASWKGALGAIVGGVLGFPFGPLGIFLGSVAGSMIFEFIEVRDKCRALKAGVGTLVANLASILAKLVLTTAYAIAFYLCLPVYPWSLW